MLALDEKQMCPLSPPTARDRAGTDVVQNIGCKIGWGLSFPKTVVLKIEREGRRWFFHRSKWWPKGLPPEGVQRDKSWCQVNKQGLAQFSAYNSHSNNTAPLPQSTSKSTREFCFLLSQWGKARKSTKPQLFWAHRRVKVTRQPNELNFRGWKASLKRDGTH